MVERVTARISRLILALVLLGTAAAHAQTVRGRVTDAQSGTPLPGARVSLRSSTDTANVIDYTQDDGTFVIRARRAGSYVLTVVRLGYGPASRALDLAAGQSIDADATL